MSQFKLNALIIEGNFEYMQRLSDIIEEFGGFDFESTSVGSRGLEYFKATTPHITFLDVNLPDADGISILSEMRAHDPNAKIVMVTANNDASTVREAISLGAAGYIVKPFPPAKVKKVLTARVNDLKA